MSVLEVLRRMREASPTGAAHDDGASGPAALSPPTGAAEEEGGAAGEAPSAEEWLLHHHRQVSRGRDTRARPVNTVTLGGARPRDRHVSGHARPLCSLRAPLFRLRGAARRLVGKHVCREKRTRRPRRLRTALLRK